MVLFYNSKFNKVHLVGVYCIQCPFLNTYLCIYLQNRYLYGGCHTSNVREGGRPCAVGSGSIGAPTSASNAEPRFPNKEGYPVLRDYNFARILDVTEGWALPKWKVAPRFAPSARGKAISPRGRFENPQASQAVRQARQIFPEFWNYQANQPEDFPPDWKSPPGLGWQGG